MDPYSLCLGFISMVCAYNPLTARYLTLNPRPKKAGFGGATGGPITDANRTLFVGRSQDRFWPRLCCGPGYDKASQV